MMSFYSTSVHCRGTCFQMVVVFAMAVDVHPEVSELPSVKLMGPDHGQPCGLPGQGQTVHIKPSTGQVRCCKELFCGIGTLKLTIFK